MGKPGEPYEPSNGTEGCGFTAMFCDVCEKDRRYRETDNNDFCCMIFSNSLVFGSKDKEYPKEWTFDKEGHPTCTAFLPEKTTIEKRADREDQAQRERFINRSGRVF